VGGPAGARTKGGAGAPGAASSCPTPWKCADIGHPIPAGSQSFNSKTGKWTINAGGADISGFSDGFRFVGKTLPGNGSVIAHVLTTAGLDKLLFIYILAAVQGCANALDNPARQAFLIEMVGMDDLPNAVALNSSQFQLSRLVGPALGGIAIATVGTVQIVNNLSTLVLSKMFSCSERYHRRATAVWHGSHANVETHGMSAEGEFFIAPLTDTFGGGIAGGYGTSKRDVSSRTRARSLSSCAVASISASAARATTVVLTVSAVTLLKSAWRTSSRQRSRPVPST